jgi:xanthine/uracil permease
MSGRLTVSIALLVASGATELVVFAGGHGAIRVGLALGFLLLAPGWAILRLIDLDLDGVSFIGLAVALSACVDMAVATALLYARVWSAELALTAIVLGVVVAIILDLPTARTTIDRGVRRAWTGLSNLGRP